MEDFATAEKTHVWRRVDHLRVGDYVHGDCWGGDREITAIEQGVIVTQLTFDNGDKLDRRSYRIGYEVMYKLPAMEQSAKVREAK